MRRRVATVYVTLLVVACLGLAWPLSSNIAARGTSEMVLDRIHDSARLAGVAEPSVLTGSAGTLAGELAAYDEMYGIAGVVLDRDGGIVASSRPDLEGTGLEGIVGEPADMPGEVRTALAGGRLGPDTVIWPWHEAPLVVAEPVGSGEVVGVVVTASPTGGLRRAILLQWAFVWAAALSVLAVGIIAAGPLTRWVLRPIHDLDEATRAVSEGSLDARVPAGDGPWELRRLGEAFNLMADTITSMLESQRTFVAYAGHQVRNPLAALRLRVESLGRHLPEAGTREHRLALDEVDRLTRICDSLLTLARTEDADHSLMEEDAREVAEDRVAAWLPIAERAGARLECGGAGPVSVHCVEGTLDQALDALIDNALKYGGQGAHIRVIVEGPATGEGTAVPAGFDASGGPDGPAVSADPVVPDDPAAPADRAVPADSDTAVGPVDTADPAGTAAPADPVVVADRGAPSTPTDPAGPTAPAASVPADPPTPAPEPRVTVRVVDDGPGLSAEQLDEATRPFWRDGGRGGSGLGLSIVVTLLEMQGGKLSLAPARPHGIDARISLPVRPAPSRGRART